MSNSLAIATVTEALKNLLTSYLDFSEVTASNVSTLSPDATTIPIPGINVFLYQISPNAALRNQDLPTRTQSGKLLTQAAGGHRPALSADLLRRLLAAGAAAAAGRGHPGAALQSGAVASADPGGADHLPRRPPP